MKNIDVEDSCTSSTLETSKKCIQSIPRKQNSTGNFEAEIKPLCLQLRAVCDKRGVEINPSKSAEIIYKLGLVYSKKSPDKIFLIKSVGLLNSAIARKPNNVFEIKKDLSDICRHILQQANALNHTTDLIVKANNTKAKISFMRSETNRALTILNTVENSEKERHVHWNYRQIYKVISMKNIQLQIASHYKNIMKDLSQFCEYVMGPPPCKFAVVGLGSLARDLITPYSDFEHIILLEIHPSNENHLEYFRWFSVIFQVVILNLQETIIPSLNIMYLNDKTCDLGDWFFDTQTSGVSFDGMMPHACKFPLGRTQPTEKKPWTTELIKPVDKMLKYLSSEVELKNGYHLDDILMETCFVYGHHTLHDEFQNGIKLYKESKTQNEILDDLQQQVKEDMDNFATRIRLANLKPTDVLNVKQMFYRSSMLFIAALGKIHGTASSSCFDIIDELVDQEKITENTKRKLAIATAISCEIRLRFYQQEKSQRDYIKPQGKAGTIFDEILKVIDIDSIINYFQITYCLQREVTRLLNIKGTHIYSNASLLNITICYALKLNEMMLLLVEKYKDTSDSDLRFSEVDKETHTLENFSTSSNSTIDEESGDSFLFDSCLRPQNYINNNFDKWIWELESEMQHSYKVASISGSQPELRKIFGNLSHFAFLLYEKDYGEALEFWKRLLEILQSPYLSDKEVEGISKVTDYDIASLIPVLEFFIADCMVELGQCDESFFKNSQVLCDFNHVQNKNFDNAINLYFRAGNIWFKMKDYEKSLACLLTSLGLALSIGLEKVKGNGIRIMYSGVGACLLHLHQYEASLIYLNKAFDTANQAKLNNDDNYDLLCFAFSKATTQRNLGKCLMHLQQFPKSLLHLQKALEITTENVHEESDIKLIQLAETSVWYAKRANEIAQIYFDLGLWNMKQNYFKQALTYFQRSSSIFKTLVQNDGVNQTRVKLLTCYMEVYQRERVEKYLKDLHKSIKVIVSIAEADEH